MIPTLHRLRPAILGLLLALPAVAHAAGEHGVTVVPGKLYLSPDTGSSKLDDVQRGRDLAILESSGAWLHVLATVSGPVQECAAEDVEYADRPREVTGWIESKYVVRPSTPRGDAIVFGEAVDSEREAGNKSGRAGAAEDAIRLYALGAEIFPNSPLAGESQWRAADIRWQIDQAESRSRPSAHERDPYMRHLANERCMKQVEKKFPRSRWADLAAFSLLDNKLCGDWQGDVKCPEKESNLYAKYADEHPQSPKAVEALYEAAWRQRALVDMFRANGDPKRSDAARQRALDLAGRVTSGYPQQTDWFARAQALVYMVQQSIPLYGSATAPAGIDAGPDAPRP